MHLPKINGGSGRPRLRVRRSDRQREMQLIAGVPDELTGACVVWNLNMQHKRRASSSHRHYDTPPLDAHRLRRPVECVEELISIGAAQPGILASRFLCVLDDSEKSIRRSSAQFGCGERTAPWWHSAARRGLARVSRDGGHGDAGRDSGSRRERPPSGRHGGGCEARVRGWAGDRSAPSLSVASLR